MKGQPLANFVEELRRQIDLAQISAEHAKYRSVLSADKIVLTIQVVADSEMSASGGVNFWAVTLGTDLKEGSSRTHSVTFEFTPLQKPAKRGGGGGGTPSGAAADDPLAHLVAPRPSTVVEEEAAENQEYRKIVFGYFNQLSDYHKADLLKTLLAMSPENVRSEFLSIAPTERSAFSARERITQIAPRIRPRTKITRSDLRTGENLAEEGSQSGGLETA